MFPAILFPEGMNFQRIITAVTAVQKIVSIFTLGASIYHGTIFHYLNQYLIPESKAMSWISYLSLPWLNSNPEHNVEDCQSLPKIYISHHCINSLLVTDDATVLNAIRNMSPFPKSVFLLIVRSCQILAPYLLQLSILLMILLVGTIVLSAAKKIIQAFGPRERAGLSLQEAIFSWISYLAVIPGFVGASYIYCFASSPTCNQGCNYPLCLYCITGLSKTIFKPFISTSRETAFLCTVSVIIASLILTVLLYYITTFLLCLAFYVLMDAVNSVWKIGSASGGTQFAWNQYKPSFRDLTSRLLPGNRTNSGNQTN